eukprot:CAMPEP_0114514656 /NCGR_PEP_ID=MMETSP0109-20121206/16277_1 /TAXON_ID=29199 /ORGANISM="Chlorarachnion reptans, Strain CCCM449" /LENGTH=399 /DNA_ID=CAMNT_0001694725 /DNA_START=110 /DNA_END=1307 /DNA_ORIENTATION=+
MNLWARQKHSKLTHVKEQQAPQLIVPAADKNLAAQQRRRRKNLAGHSPRENMLGDQTKTLAVTGSTTTTSVLGLAQLPELDQRDLSVAIAVRSPDRRGRPHRRDHIHDGGGGDRGSGPGLLLPQKRPRRVEGPQDPVVAAEQDDVERRLVRGGREHRQSGADRELPQLRPRHPVERQHMPVHGGDDHLKAAVLAASAGDHTGRRERRGARVGPPERPAGVRVEAPDAALQVGDEGAAGTGRRVVDHGREDGAVELHRLDPDALRPRRGVHDVQAAVVAPDPNPPRGRVHGRGRLEVVPAGDGPRDPPSAEVDGVQPAVVAPDEHGVPVRRGRRGGLDAPAELERREDAAVPRGDHFKPARMRADDAERRPQLATAAAREDQRAGVDAGPEVDRPLHPRP